MSSEMTKELFEKIPGRVQAAMQLVQFCAAAITDPCRCCNPQAQGRALSPRERAAYDAALEALRLYLAGEVDMSGPAMTAPPPADEPPPPPPFPRPQRRWGF